MPYITGADTLQHQPVSGMHQPVQEIVRTSKTVSNLGVDKCTGSYGAGLLRYLQSVKIEVLEVTAPDKMERRQRG